MTNQVMGFDNSVHSDKNKNIEISDIEIQFQLEEQTHCNDGSKIINEDSADQDLMKPPSITKVLKSATPLAFACDVCEASFKQKWKLIYHIRKNHFNLKAKIPYHERRKVNQVWFETVNNRDTVVEMKKTGLNTLLIKKSERTEVDEDDCRIIDLTYVYPTNKRMEFVECNVCKFPLASINLKTHFKKAHSDVSTEYCIKCAKSFRKLINFVKHCC